MKVREIVDRVLTLNGEERVEDTCDLLLEGDGEQPVTGIVVTFMATVDVIRQAVEAGCNLIITHEPIYFTGRDKREWLRNDPVYHAKKAFIDDSRISIWRYHDHMHHGKTDLIYAGMQKELGWYDFLDAGMDKPQHCYSIPPVSLESLVTCLKDKLDIKVIRVLGDLNMMCSRVGMLVGAMSMGMNDDNMPAAMMNDKNLDVMICGEVLEWTLTPYVRDASAMGFKKAMIVLGHAKSEEAGMKHLPALIQPLVGDIPVRFIDSGEPFLSL